MSRNLITDLQPGVRYQLQVRAVGSDNVSEWSRVYQLETMAYVMEPMVPNNPVWEVNGDSFHAEWDPVFTNINAEEVTIDHYDLELTANNQVMIVTVAQGPSRMSYDLSFEANRALWGVAQPSITFRVRAVDNIGLQSDWTLPITAVNAPPAAPTDLTATGVTDGVYLKWTAPDDTDLVGYNIYIGANANPTTKINNTPITSTEYNYATLTYLLQHFKVVSVDRFGQTSAGIEATATPKSPFTADTTAPNTPTALSAVISNNENGIGATAAVSWTMDSAPDDLAGYYIRYREVGDTHYSTVTFTKDVNDGTIFLPLAYTDYEFQIKAFDWASNESAWSATVTATSPDANSPAKVSGVMSTPDQGTIQYVWTPSVEKNIADYQVDIATNSGFTTGLLTFHTGTSTALTVNGLSESTTYYMRVRAVNNGGIWGAYSDTDTETTPANTTLTTVSADIITPGTLGLAGGGAINIGAGASLVTNGGAIKSNSFNGTFTGGIYNNDGTAGFYIDNGNVIIPQGKISASALDAGTIGGTKTITLSGPNAKIVAGSWSLSGDGLSIPNGAIDASKLKIQAGAPNLVPAQHSSFEYPTGYYSGLGTAAVHNGSSGTLDISTTRAYHGAKSLIFTMSNTAGTANAYLEYTGGPAIAVTPNTTYIVSAYVYQEAGTANDSTAQLFIDGSANGGTYRGIGSATTVGSNSWVRIYSTVTTGASETAIVVKPRITYPGTTAITNRVYYVDAIMVEAQQNTAVTPSIYNTGGYTEISGDLIKTGSIHSTAQAIDGDGNVIPNSWAWSIDTAGSAVLGNAQVTGNLLVGNINSTSKSVVQSANFISNLDDVTAGHGWRISSDGTAEFYNVTALNLDAVNINTGSISPSVLSDGTLSNTILLNGKLEAQGTDNNGWLYKVGLSKDGFYSERWTGDGLTMNKPFIQFPTNGSPNIISGKLTSVNLVVTSDDPINQPASFLVDGAMSLNAGNTFSLNNGTKNPPSPTVNTYWQRTAANGYYGFTDGNGILAAMFGLAYVNSSTYASAYRSQKSYSTGYINYIGRLSTSSPVSFNINYVRNFYGVATMNSTMTSVLSYKQIGYYDIPTSLNQKYDDGTVSTTTYGNGALSMNGIAYSPTNGYVTSVVIPYDAAPNTAQSSIQSVRQARLFVLNTSLTVTSSTTLGTTTSTDFYYGNTLGSSQGISKATDGIYNSYPNDIIISSVASPNVMRVARVNFSSPGILNSSTNLVNMNWSATSNGWTMISSGTSWNTSSGIAAAGNFDFGRDCFVFEDYGNAWYHVFDSSTGALLSKVSGTGPTVQGWSFPTGTNVWGTTYDESVGRFVGVLSTHEKVTFQSGMAYQKGIAKGANVYLYTTYARDSTFESGRSPSAVIVWQNRAMYTVSITAIPYNSADTASPNKMNIYLYGGFAAADPGQFVTSIYQPDTSLSFGSTSYFLGSGPATGKPFPISTPSKITGSNGLSITSDGYITTQKTITSGDMVVNGALSINGSLSLNGYSIASVSNSKWVQIGTTIICWGSGQLAFNNQSSNQVGVSFPITYASPPAVTISGYGSGRMVAASSTGISTGGFNLSLVEHNDALVTANYGYSWMAIGPYS